MRVLGGGGVLSFEFAGRTLATVAFASTFSAPEADRTIGALAGKYGWAIGRLALTNPFREDWPDIPTDGLHLHP